jgi:hypothetical protein
VKLSGGSWAALDIQTIIENTGGIVRVRSMIASVVVFVAATATAAATPAFASTVGNTATTFSVTAGGLAITVPTSANLGAGAPGTLLPAPLGVVQVVDQRALLNATWTTTVTGTNFTTGTATAAETVTTAFVDYWSGHALTNVGTGTFTPGQASAAQEQNLTTPRVAFTMTGGTGNTSASWNPTLEIEIPLSAVFGVYNGTVTHSVS